MTRVEWFGLTAALLVSAGCGEADEPEAPACELEETGGFAGTYLGEIIHTSVDAEPCDDRVSVTSLSSMTLVDLGDGDITINGQEGQIEAGGRFSATVSVSEEALVASGEVYGTTDGVVLYLNARITGTRDGAACSESWGGALRKLLDSDRRRCCSCLESVGCTDLGDGECAAALDADVDPTSRDDCFHACEGMCWFRPEVHWI